MLGKIKHKTTHLLAIAAQRLMLGKIKHKTYSTSHNHSLTDGYYCWYQTMLGKIKHKTYSTYTSTITAWLTAIAAGVRLVLGKIKHKTYLTSTITA